MYLTYPLAWGNTYYRYISSRCQALKQGKTPIMCFFALHMGKAELTVFLRDVGS